VEIAALIVNTSDGPLEAGGVSARVSGQGAGLPSRSWTLDPWQTKWVRVAAPIGACSPETDASVTVSFAGREVDLRARLPKLLPPCTIHVLEGFHCDPVWVSDQRHYNLISLENVKMHLDACLVDPGYHAFVHEIDYLKSFIDEYPDYRTKVFELVSAGRLLVGSSYSEPNENNISGEAIVRNILYGDAFHRHFLGGHPGVYHAWDVFGHIPQLSQILAKSKHDGALWSKSVLGLPPLFRHMALDGTTLTHIRSHYTWYSSSIDNLRTISEPLIREKQSYGLSRHLMVEASDFTPPSAWMVGKTGEMAESYPRIVMSGPEEFLHGLAEDGARFPITSRNPSQHHVGTFHTRVELKLANRMAENLLYAAECWSTFSALLGASYPDRSLDKAWRQLLFGQHHDAITGTPCDVSYLDLMAGYREALRIARGVLDEATAYLADAVAAPAEGKSVVVFNPLSWPRTGVVSVPKPDGYENVEVRAASGSVTPSVVKGSVIEICAPEVPSVGFTTLTLHPVSAAAVQEQLAETVLENEFWRIHLDPDRGGGIQSLFDKRALKEIIDGSLGVGNDLIALGNGPNPWEFHTTGERIYASQTPAHVEIRSCATGQTAVITGKLGTVCSYKRTLTLRPNSRAIEASVRLSGYRSEGHQFVMTVPTALSGTLPVFEDKFGTVVTRRGKTKHDYHTSGSSRASDCAIFPVYNWMEAGWSARAISEGGTTGLNLGMMGMIIPHDVAMEDASAPLLKALNHVGITTTLYFDDDDNPRKDELALGAYGELFYHHLSDDTVLPRSSDMSMAAQWLAVSVGGNNTYVAALLNRLPEEVRRSIGAQEEARGWGMILAEDTNVPAGWNSMPVIVLTAVSMDPLGQAFAEIASTLTSDTRISLPEGADFRVASGSLDDYGFAILTTGTGAATMEPDGTLTLFLGRTSEWAQNNMIDHKINPELRDMVFHYGFTGHEGSWRDGGVVRAGFELNNPLTAAMPSGHGSPVLPAEHSFLSFDAPEAVITAIKPSGNPVARFEDKNSDPANGIVVRAYDALGKGASGSLKLSGGIDGAWATDLLENDGAAISVTDGIISWPLNPFSIETVRLVPRVSPSTVSAKREIGAAWRPAHPVWCRYYQHNVGAHPTGYLPVAIYVDGELPIENRGGQFPTVGKFRVWVVNNHTDRGISGTATLSTPGHWSLIPEAIQYDLGPRDHVVREIVLAYDRRPRVGLIKARIEYDGVVYQDILEAGFRTTTRGIATEGGAVRFNGWEVNKEREPEWTVLRDAGDIVVRVRNPWLQPLEVEFAIVSPMETWGGDAGSYGLCDIRPDHTAVTLAAREQREIRFGLVSDASDTPTFWAWVKIMCNGKCDYRPVPGTTA
jgi:alpha-mannosidase